ncbi:MAG: hypothetical protein M3N93_07480 [Acidobacteriota bacterium]|nr:hypothetical protein [Acidobacteriota bacterium]
MRRSFLLYLLIGCFSAWAQTARQFVATVNALKPESAEIVVKPDGGEAITVQVSSSTVVQRVAPREHDLKNAATIGIGDVAVADRVLVAVEPGTTELRRIVVMSAGDITKRDEADRLDWTTRGISGIVRERKGDAITLVVKSMGGEDILVVRPGPKTTFRRYGAGVVRFAEATPSGIGEIRTGDQMRVRGKKSAEGSVLVAEDIVFGTFQTRVGSVISADPGARLLVLKEQGTGKTIRVNVSPDAQIKAVESVSPGLGGAGRPDLPGGGMVDLAKIVEHLPAATLAHAKPGQTVIVSSTKGTDPDEMAAITIVVNADMLIRMAAIFGGRRAGQSPGDSSNGPGAAGDGGNGMSSGGMPIDLSGITP